MAIEIYNEFSQDLTRHDVLIMSTTKGDTKLESFPVDKMTKLEVINAIKNSIMRLQTEQELDATAGHP